MQQKMVCTSITPSIGAEVSGFDCSNVDSDNKEMLRRLLISRKVLVFRDQILIFLVVQYQIKLIQY